MKRFYIDLSDKVTTVYSVDRYFVSYEDFDYATDNTLDVLYSKMYGLEIEEVIVIMHGEIVENAKYAFKLRGITYSESKSDYEQIKHLCRALGIPNCMFYEFGSFYCKANEDVVVVQETDCKMNVIALTHEFSEVQTCTQEFLATTVNSLLNKYGIKKVVNIHEYQDQKMLSYFKNSAIVSVTEREVLNKLTLFAFAMTNVAEDLGKITDQVFLQENKAVKQVDVKDVAVDDLTEPVKEAKEPKKSVKSKKVVKQKKKESSKSEGSSDKKKKKRFGLPFGLAVFLIFLNAFLVLCLAKGSSITETMANNSTTKYNQAVEALTNCKQRESAYKISSGQSKGTNDYEVVEYLLKKLPKNSNIVSLNGVIHVVIKNANKDKINKIVSDVRSKYTVNNFELGNNRRGANTSCKFDVKVL